MSSLKKESAYLYLIQISNFVIPLLVLPFLTNVLGLAGLGRLGIAQSLFFFMGFLIDFGFTFSASRHISLHKNNSKELNKIFTNVQLLRGLIYIFFSIFICGFILFLELQVLEKVAYIVAVLSSVSAIITPSWLFNGLAKNSTLSLFTLIFRLITLFPIFVLIGSPDDFLVAFVIQNTSMIILGIVVSWYIRFKIGIVISRNYIDISYMKRMFVDGFDTFSGSILSVVYTTCIPFIAKVSLGDYWVGIYTLTEKVLSVLKQLFMPVMQACYSKLCTLYSENKLSEICKISLLISVLYFSLTVVALLANYFLGKIFIDVFFAGKQIIHKYIYISILGQFVVGLSIVLIYGNILASGKGYILKRIYLKGALVFIVLLAVGWNNLSLSYIYFYIILAELVVVCSAMFFIYAQSNILKENK